MGLKGVEAKPFIDDLANLRCTVFREYPYLYAGDLDYEQEYLAHFVNSPNSFLVLAKDQDRIIGVSTCTPMSDADPAFQQPFIEADYDLSSIGYFGESVLLPEFRGHGVGHRFFDLREQWAVEQNFSITAFCAVLRPDQHPERPVDHRPHDAFWKKRGYQRHDQLLTQLDWQEIHDPAGSVSPHSLVFWLKS